MSGMLPPSLPPALLDSLSVAVAAGLKELSAPASVRWCRAALQEELPSLPMLVSHAQSHGVTAAIPASLLAACRDACWARLLYSPLEDVFEETRLPANLAGLQRSTLAGSHLLQVVECVDIAHSHAELTEKPVCHDRVWKMQLTDGVAFAVAMERQPIAELTHQLMQPGVKLVLRDVPIRWGTLLLEPGNVRMLGGGAPGQEVANGAQADGKPVEEESKQAPASVMARPGPIIQARGIGPSNSAAAAAAMSHSAAASSSFVAASSLPAQPQPSIWQRGAQLPAAAAAAAASKPAQPPVTAAARAATVAAPAAAATVAAPAHSFFEEDDFMDDAEAEQALLDAEALEHSAAAAAAPTSSTQQQLQSASTSNRAPITLPAAQNAPVAPPRKLFTVETLFSPEPDADMQEAAAAEEPAAAQNGNGAAAAGSSNAAASSSIGDHFSLSQSMPALEQAPPILDYISPQIDTKTPPATEVPTAAAKPTSSLPPKEQAADLSMLTPPPRSAAATAATPQSARSAPQLTPLSASFSPSVATTQTTVNMTAHSPQVRNSVSAASHSPVASANSPATRMQRGDLARMAASSSNSPPMAVAVSARSRSRATGASPSKLKLEGGASGASAAGAPGTLDAFVTRRVKQQPADEGSSVPSSPNSCIMLPSPQKQKQPPTLARMPPSMTAKREPTAAAATAAAASDEMDDFLEADSPTAPQPSASQQSRLPPPSTPVQSDEIQSLALARALEVTRTAGPRLFAPSDPLFRVFEHLPYVYLRDLPKLASRLEKPLQVLVRVRMVGVVHICLERSGAFELHLRVQDVYTDTDVSYAVPLLENIIGCTAAQWEHLSEAERENKYDILQEFIDAADSMVQLKISPQSTALSQPTPEMEPLIMHLRPVDEQDSKVLLPPKPA